MQDEILVHNLEHGFVNVHYNTTDPILIGQIEAAARGLPNWPNYYLFAPYPDMDATIALTAWNRVLYLDSVDEDAMQQFADAYQARGPEVARGCDAPGLMQAGVVPEVVPTIEVCRSQLRPPPAVTTAPIAPQQRRQRRQRRGCCARQAAQPRSRPSRRRRTPGSGSTHAVHGTGLCDAEAYGQ